MFLGYIIKTPLLGGVEKLNILNSYRMKYTSTGRSAYWDTVKGFLILLVVVGHYFYDYRNATNTLL